MIKEEFNKVYEKYNPIFAPMISKMIQDNYKYFQIAETIRWKFGYDNDLAIMGTCDRKNNEIHLNIFSVKKAYEDNNLMDEWNSDLFICEGTYGDDKDKDKAIKNKHMTFKEAALLAKEGKVHELLLTHFSPAVIEPELFKENATSIFENTIIGSDRLVKSLAFRNE